MESKTPEFNRGGKKKGNSTEQRDKQLRASNFILCILYW